MACKSWGNVAVKVHTKVLSDDPAIDITLAELAREQVTTEYAAYNKPGQQVYRLDDGTSTFNLNLRVIGEDAVATMNELRALETDQSPGCPNRSVLLNVHANTLVPTTDIKVLEFSVPLQWDGLFGGEARTEYVSENAMMTTTWEEVSALPVIPANESGTDLTGGDALIAWDVDTEKYLRQEALDRVAYFVVERRPTAGGPWAVVSPAAGVANTAGDSGQVEFTDSPGAGNFDYQVKAVDQYGMESEYTAVIAVVVT